MTRRLRVPADWTRRAYVDEAKYREMYDRSQRDPEAFWASTAGASIG